MVDSRAKVDASKIGSDAWMSALLRLMPVAVYTCDNEGRLTFFNDRAVECWRRKLGDIHDRWCGSFRMWLPDGSLLKHENCPMVDAARDGRAIRNAEIVLEQPSGDRLMTDVCIDPLYDKHGKLIGAINVFEDITRRKRVEAAFVDSEAKLAAELADSQRLQQNSTRLIVEGDLDGLYSSILEAARSLMRSDMASIQVYELEREEVHLLAHHCFTAKSAVFWEWVRADTGSSCGRALASDERMLVPDMDLFDGDPDDVEAYRNSGILSVQSTPLRAHSGQIIGMLSTPIGGSGMRRCDVRLSRSSSCRRERPLAAQYRFPNHGLLGKRCPCRRSGSRSDRVA